MRTALTLLALAALACTAERPEADTGMTPPLESAPDSADESFVSEHGFRIPLKNQAEFLACAKEVEEVGDWGWMVATWDWRRPETGDVRHDAVGAAVLIGLNCVPDEAIPAEGLGFCEQRGASELQYCPEAGAPFYTVMPASPGPTTAGEALK